MGRPIEGAACAINVKRTVGHQVRAPEELKRSRPSLLVFQGFELEFKVLGSLDLQNPYSGVIFFS